MKSPLITIVIPTKNSEKTIGECLESITAQTHQNYELIIVDGFSNDKTRSVAEKYTDKIFTSSSFIPGARNVGYSQARGSIFLSIDSDMILEKNVLEDIVVKMNGHGGLIIPEVGYGNDFMSKCKDLEKRCYIRDEIVESARAFSQEAFHSVKGYDANLILGEDWDMHWRVKERFSIGRTEAKIMHNTKNFSLLHDLKKAYKYGNSLPRYLIKGSQQSKDWLNLGNPFFVRHFRKLIREPLYAAGLLIVKSLEYAVGFVGFVVAKLVEKNE